MERLIDEAIVWLANIRQLKPAMNQLGKAQAAIKLEQLYRHILMVSETMPMTDENRAFRRLGFMCRDTCDNMFK